MKLIKLLSLVAIVGLLVTCSMASRNRHLLLSDSAPWGIVSLELTKSDSVQYRIFSQWNRTDNYVFERDWKNPAESMVAIAAHGKRIVEPGKQITGVDTAERQTRADNWFILFYVFSLILLFWHYYQHVIPAKNRIKSWQFWLLSGAVVLAGLLDLVENHYILNSIDLFKQLNPIRPIGDENTIPTPINNLNAFVKSGQAAYVFYFASFKFIILILILILFSAYINIFKRLTGWLSSLSSGFVYGLKLSWTFRIVLIILFILFAFLNFSDQGQDLLITINTSLLGTLIFLFSVSVLAAMNWYLPKLYVSGLTDLYLTVPKGFRMTKGYPMYYARLLGLLTFLIPAVAILNTMKQYHMPYLLDDVPVMVILVVAIIGYQQLLKHNTLDLFFAPNGGFSFVRFIAVMAFLFGLMIGFYFIKNNSVEQYGRLSYLSLNLFVLSFGFLISVTYRSKIVLIKDIQVAPIVLITGLLLALAFILFNISLILFTLIAEFRFFTIAIVIAALICYALIFSYLLVLGKRFKIQFITFILLIGFLISYSKMSSFHKVYTVEAKGDEPQVLTGYIRNWLTHRRAEIDAYKTVYNKPYPIFFLNSYGGGIRASVWATMVVGELDSLVLTSRGSNRISDDFQHHVFSFSGASGGTVGFSLLSADRLSIRDSISSRRFYPDNSKVYKYDYLTPNVVGLFGRDVLMSIIGASWYDDRSRLQERGFESVLKCKFGIDYDIALRAAWKKNNLDLPLLFSNTYDINTGKKGIVAPVLLDHDDFPSCIFIQDLMREKKLDLPLSTAAFLSARFPYVSPTGKFDEKHHFTDGGTLENSGAETSMQVITVFKRILEEEAFKGLNVTINVLSISNSLLTAEHPVKDKNLYEVLAPAVGILQTISSNAIKADTVNSVIVGRHKENNWSYNKIQPTRKMIAGNWPVLPLGWQISDDALEVMRRSIHSQRASIDSILFVFGTKIVH